MPTFFHKPENALKRAKEFIEVDKKESALEVLNDVIKSKKHRGSGNKVHEEIANLFLIICTDLQKSSTAKNGLYQYRNISGNVDPASFDKVVKTFLGEANNRAKNAREQSQQAVLDIDDLDQLQTPESLLLITVSDEDTQARTDRVMLTPWVKFLWESYRNILELTKNNQTFEKLYTEVAKEAFHFCIEYKRRTEFRKLCDTLRNHLQLIQKHQPPTQSYAINFGAPDSKSIQYQVEVRFEQLECSITIDLWQEAFKAIEEIHNLLISTKTQSKPSTYFNFYSRQARVFWMAKNYLFHAAAVHCQFVLIKEQKKSSSQEELQRIASQVLLATMSIPIVPVSSESTRLLQQDSFAQEKDRRLAGLLRLSVTPTRHSLHKDLEKLGVLQYVPDDLSRLYHLLEVDYSPLTLCANVQPILTSLEANDTLKQYMEPLKSITVVRLIKEVSQLYQSITLTRLQELVPFVSRWELEKVVVETAMSNKLRVHIDHSTQSLHFGNELTTFSDEDAVPEGPFVQGMPSDRLRSHLALMSQALNQVAQLIGKEKISAAHSKEQAALVAVYHKHEAADRKMLLKRQAAIENRKEYIEKVQRERDREEFEQKQKKEEKEKKAEKLRLQKEREERESERVRLEVDKLKKQMQLEKFEQLKKSAVGHKILMDYDPNELQDIDPDEIMLKQLKQMEKQRKDTLSKLRQQEKKVDYLERAKRLEEIPLLQKHGQEQMENDRKFHNEQEEEKIASAITERNTDVEMKNALTKMVADKDDFLKVVQAKRSQQYEEKLAAYAEKYETLKEERLNKRKEARKEQRKQEYQITKEAKRVEDAKLAKEAEEREITEAFEKQAKIQMEREREIEEKRLQKKPERSGLEESAAAKDPWRREENPLHAASQGRAAEDGALPREDRRYLKSRETEQRDRSAPQDTEDARRNREGEKGLREEADDNWRQDPLPSRRQEDGRDRDDWSRGNKEDSAWKRGGDPDGAWRKSRDDRPSREQDRLPRDFDQSPRDKPRYGDRPRDQDKPRYDDRPRYRDDDRPRYNRDDDRPRYNRDDDRSRYNRDDDRPRYNRDDDRPRYNRDDDRPRYNRDGDRPPPRSYRDDQQSRDDNSSEGPRKYVPPAARRQEGEQRSGDGGDGWRSKDDGGKWSGDRRDPSPKRGKPEKEVDDDGFEIVRPRR